MGTLPSIRRAPDSCPNLKTGYYDFLRDFPHVIIA